MYSPKLIMYGSKRPKLKQVIRMRAITLGQVSVCLVMEKLWQFEQKKKVVMP